MIIDAILWSLLLWLFFIVFANTRKYTGKDYNPAIQALAHLTGVLFGAFDIAFNLIYGSIIFIDFPREFLLTTRLKRLIADGDARYDWRTKLASKVCRYMIEPWDFNHCAINR